MKRYVFSTAGFFAAIAAALIIFTGARAVAVSASANAPYRKPLTLDEQIAQAVSIYGHAFVYFYSNEYKTSGDEAGRISDLANKEKAGFVKINIGDRDAALVARTFSLNYVPTVVHIKKNFGVVEQFSGPRNVKQLTSNRKAPARLPHSDQIEKISKGGGVTILEFYADWCGPCMEQMPKLEEAVKTSDGKLNILKLHVDKEPALMNLYNVDSPPSNIILDSNGVPRMRTNSISSPAALLSMLTRMGII